MEVMATTFSLSATCIGPASMLSDPMTPGLHVARTHGEYQRNCAGCRKPQGLQLDGENRRHRRQNAQLLCRIASPRAPNLMQTGVARPTPRPRQGWRVLIAQEGMPQWPISQRISPWEPLSAARWQP